MAVTYNDNVDLEAPKSLDKRYQKFSGGAGVPFASLNEANTANVLAVRHIGLTVLIDIGGTPTEYWYIGGIADGNLVVKATGEGGDFEEVDY